jgi:hypothetical protein
MLSAHLTIPKSGIMQNKSSIRGMFSHSKNDPELASIPPQVHHQKPRSGTRFSQKPGKNSKVSLQPA